MPRRARRPAFQVEQLEDRLTPAGSIVPAGEFNWTQYSPTGELGQLVWNGGTLTYRARVAGAWQSTAVAASAGYTLAAYNSADDAQTASQTAQLVFTSDGTPHALFLEKQWNGTQGKYQTLIQHYARTSAGWQKVETINGGLSQWGPSNLVAEAGPNNTIHLIFTDTSVAATGVGSFGTGALNYATSANGWAVTRIAGTADLSQDVWFTGGRWAPRFLSLAVDAQGKAHVTYTPQFYIAGAFSTVNSTLMYATNKGGAWASQVVMAPQDGTADAGLGASVAVSAAGQVAVASYYVDRFATGSPQTSQLMYHTLTAGGWTHAVVTAAPDGYVAGDGAKFTGFAPDLSFDSAGRPTIVFSDEAGAHLPVSFANQFAGQIRTATLTGTTWALATVFRQTDPIRNQLFYPVAATYNGQTTYAGLMATSTVDGNKNPTRTDFTVIDVGAPSGLTSPPVSTTPPVKPPTVVTPPAASPPVVPPPVVPPVVVTPGPTTVATVPAAPAPTTASPSGWAVALDAGASASQVFVFRADGGLAMSVTPYGSNYRGGVRFARADFTGDGVPDLITVPAAGVAAQVRVWDGTTGALVADLAPFAGYTGGLWVAVGDVNRDGVPDAAFGTDGGTVPGVAVLSGRDASSLGTFLAYTPGTAGGVRLAIGDVNRDGYADVVTAPGAGSPLVSVFDGRALATTHDAQKLVPDFYLYPSVYQFGANVAVGDINGDGYADIVGGPNVGPAYLRAVSGRALTTGQGTLDLLNGVAWSGTNSGIRVTVADADGDGRADLLATPGGASGSYTALYTAPALSAGDLSNGRLLTPLPGISTAIFVG